MFCRWLAILQHDEEVRFCRHARHHSRQNLVTAASCEGCPLRDTPCDDPRPIPEPADLARPPKPSSPPLNIAQRVANWMDANEKWKAAGRPERTDEEVAAIYDTHCRPCEHLTKLGTCAQCGCILKKNLPLFTAKIKMATEHCPLDNW